MQILLNAICRAGLNRGRIRDALAGTENYKGVTGDMVFDPNSKNIAPMFLAHVHNATIEYRRITMEKPYARVGENGVQYAGPKVPDEIAGDLKIGVFGPHADELVRWVLGWGAQAEILAPPDARARIASLSREVADKY